MKVFQRWFETPRVRSMSRYFATVRADTRMPNFTIISSAILSSPQVGFSRSICRISVLMFLGSAGRPEGRDFHRQNKPNASRCQRTKVSGLTITSASRQAKAFPNQPMSTGPRLRYYFVLLYVPRTGRVAFARTDFRLREISEQARKVGKDP